MIDRYGNQIHISYSQLSVSGTIRDAVLKDITYDDPTCHNTSSACSTWNPLVDLHFDASQSVAHLLNSGCGSGSSTARCDDPVDSTLPAPKVMSAYVLNDVKVQVNGNLLREYVFSYNQGGPMTKADPNTGQNESVAGYLTLGKIQEEGTNGTTLNAPVVTISYVQQWEHYSDTFSYSDNGAGDLCSSYANAPRDGSSTGPCYLWSVTYNHFYISNLDNGEGWNESITWQEAHSNTWGVDGGAVNDAFNCSSSQTSTNYCGRADDKNWSRVVVQKRTATSNGVSATWSYKYYLQTGIGISYPGFSVRLCPGSSHSWGQSCTTQTYDWGDQNDDDSADYYNGSFQSFQQVQVTLPDGSSQTDTYGATTGWGLANSSIVSGNCSLKQINSNAICYVASYYQNAGSVLATALSGKQTMEQDYDSQGHLMKQINSSWAMNCKPQGVPGTANALGGSSDPGSSQLFSELDHSNPVVVCDPRTTQIDTYLTDGVTSNLSDARVIHTTTTTTYDGNTCGAQGYDYGNVSKTDETANDVGGAHLVTATLFCPNDSISSGVYLTDLAAQTQMQDGSGTQYGCTQNFYGGNSSALATPTLPSLTRVDAYTAYTGGCTGTVTTTLHSYDASGNAITGTDADGHLGCPSGAQQYSACATYDSMGVHLLTATNAKNQVTTYEYDQDAAEAGFGEWLMSETDPNGQTTTYQYDALGRLTAVIRPGDSLSSPTITYTYVNKCSAGATTPCIELITTRRLTSGNTQTVSTKRWYDGWGNLVETQVPGPNLFSKVPAIPSELISYTVYDELGRPTIHSLPYAVAATAGLGYVAPDLNQPRTVTSYDSLGRSLGTVTYGNGTTIVQESTSSYTLALGVPTLSSESSTAYEQTITLDAYHHQSISYADGFGRVHYSQVFSGTNNPYSVIRTVGTIYDTVGNILSTLTYDSTGTLQASSNATYDGLRRLTGYNDSDRGSCANISMPTDCSSTTDTAWKFTYDADGNTLSVTDPRSQVTYASYDALDRPLCTGISQMAVNPCQNSAAELYFYDSYNNSSNPSVALPSGCTAPNGSIGSNPVGEKVAEVFGNAVGSGWRCYGYDARGELDQKSLSVTADGQTTTQTMTFAYNDAGLMSALTYPDGDTVTASYDTNGYFQGMSDSAGTIVSAVQYTNTGEISSMTIGGLIYQGSATIPLKVNIGYDSIQRPLSLSATVGGNTLLTQQRVYDNVGNVLSLDTTLPTTSGGNRTDNQSFCYDAVNRLVWAGNSGTPTGGDHCGNVPMGTTTSAYQQAFNYDNLDRLTSSSAATYTYGDTNHIHAATGLSNVPNQYAVYDARGDMICRNTDRTGAHTCSGPSPNGVGMTYDNKGRLISWTASSGTTASDQFLYDAEGNRVLQRMSSTVGSTTTITDIVMFDGFTETSITSGTISSSKYYLLGGQPLALATGSGWFTLVPDLLGNISLAVKGNGNVQAVQLFAPYGSIRYSDGSLPTAHNFTSQLLDNPTGLLYYNARYYDPLSGTFLSPDSLQGNQQGSNPYAYVRGNPETYVDPKGLDDGPTFWDWINFIVNLPPILLPYIAGFLGMQGNGFNQGTPVQAGQIDNGPNAEGWLNGEVMDDALLRKLGAGSAAPDGPQGNRRFRRHQTNDDGDCPPNCNGGGGASSSKRGPKNQPSSTDTQLPGGNGKNLFPANLGARVAGLPGNSEVDSGTGSSSSNQGTSRFSPNPGARLEGLPGNSEVDSGYCLGCVLAGVPASQGGPATGGPANIIQFPGAGNGTNTWGAGGGGAEMHWGDLGVA
jgi:RHS repeat-associated protein